MGFRSPGNCAVATRGVVQFTLSCTSPTATSFSGGAKLRRQLSIEYGLTRDRASMIRVDFMYNLVPVYVNIVCCNQKSTSLSAVGGSHREMLTPDCQRPVLINEFTTYSNPTFSPAAATRHDVLAPCCVGNYCMYPLRSKIKAPPPKAEAIRGCSCRFRQSPGLVNESTP